MSSIAGRNFTLEETIKLGAKGTKCRRHVGALRDHKKGFDLAVERKRLLDTGAIKYRKDDRLYRRMSRHQLFTLSPV
jgi:hypothetical protein